MPGGVWALGLVSLLMDMSSELIHSLLPVLMVSVLGVSVTAVGFVEGVAEATASVSKMLSGALSDYLRKRKLLVVLGYGLAALSKPLFPLAHTLGWIVTARVADRVGKGIRGAPRDALVADIVPPGQRGAAYGLRQALDTVGAIAGPALALLFMLRFGGNIQRALWIAVIPAVLAVMVLVVAVREPKAAHPRGARGARERMSFRDARRLSWDYWSIVVIGAVFTLARFSEAFLILRARDVGLADAQTPAIMVAMNIVYALAAYPAGARADRGQPRAFLLAGLGALIGADVVLGLATSPAIAFLGAALWGLHMALTQSLLSKLVADAAPADLRGTAFGLFNLVSGVALLLASAIAGAAWSRLGPAATFSIGAGFAALAAAGLLVRAPGARRPAPAASRGILPPS